jgi:hypothetical protein
VCRKVFLRVYQRWAKIIALKGVVSVGDRFGVFLDDLSCSTVHNRLKNKVLQYKFGGKKTQWNWRE